MESEREQDEEWQMQWERKSKDKEPKGKVENWETLKKKREKIGLKEETEKGECSPDDIQKLMWHTLKIYQQRSWSLPSSGLLYMFQSHEYIYIFVKLR